MVKKNGVKTVSGREDSESAMPPEQRDPLEVDHGNPLFLKKDEKQRNFRSGNEVASFCSNGFCDGALMTCDQEVEAFECLERMRFLIRRHMLMNIPALSFQINLCRKLCRHEVRFSEILAEGKRLDLEKFGRLVSQYCCMKTRLDEFWKSYWKATDLREKNDFLMRYQKFEMKLKSTLRFPRFQTEVFVEFLAFYSPFVNEIEKIVENLGSVREGGICSSVDMQSSQKRLKAIEYELRSPASQFVEWFKELNRLVCGFKKMKEKIVKANLRLVVSIAKRYRGENLVFRDLVQNGRVGLIKAIMRFDCCRGYRFSTYATWWIRQSIVKSFKEQVSFSVSECYLEKDKEELKLSSRSISSLKNPISLERTLSDDKGNCIMDFVENKLVRDPLSKAMDDLLRERILEALDSLSDREREIVRLRFGLDDDCCRTLEEIGRMFHVTRERIRQIQVKVLRKMRHPVWATKLGIFDRIKTMH